MITDIVSLLTYPPFLVFVLGGIDDLVLGGEESTLRLAYQEIGLTGERFSTLHIVCLVTGLCCAFLHHLNQYILVLVRISPALHWA